MKSLIGRRLALAWVWNAGAGMIYAGIVIFIDPVPAWLPLALLMLYLLVTSYVRDPFLNTVDHHQDSRNKFRQLIDRLHSLQSSDEIADYLTLVVRTLQLPRLLAVQYLPDPHLVLYLKRQRGRNIAFRYPENPVLLSHLKAYPWAQPEENFPPTVRRYLRRRKVAFVVPYIHRGNLYGFLGFPRNLSPDEIIHTERICRRIGLLLENASMSRQMPRREVLAREILAAERIERHLLRKGSVHNSFFAISRSDSVWNKLHFPVLFEAVTAGPERIYILLCKTAENNQRAQILQLCAIQGYFLTLAPGSEPELLIKRIQFAIREYENAKLRLDGFLIEINKDKFRFAFFGDGMGYKSDADWFWLAPRPSLGGTEGDISFSEFMSAKNIVFSLKDFPVIYVRPEKI